MMLHNIQSATRTLKTTTCYDERLCALQPPIKSRFSRKQFADITVYNLLMAITWVGLNGARCSVKYQ